MSLLLEESYPMSTTTNRRDFLKRSTAAGMGFWVSTRSVFADDKSPNEKFGVVCVGVGGRGADNVQAMTGERVLGLCEVDELRGVPSFKRLPDVPRFSDYRVMLDKLHKQIDAVVVSTPDHMHAPITLAAIDLGKHVYCEKPLTRTVAEARRVAEAAAKHKVVTQMGNDGNAQAGARRNVELIRSGVLGKVSEVHAWTDRPGAFWKQALDRPTETPAVPSTLKWDLWIGVAPPRPYHPTYLPGKWRGWYDFGTGALGDMACHICNVAFWGLDLRDPTAIEAETSEAYDETYPAWSKVNWEFPANASRPGVRFHWYDGGKKPSVDLVSGRELPDNGSIIIGEKGTLYIPNPDGAQTVLLPEERLKDFKGLPHTLPDSPEHHAEWIRNCKKGDLGLDYMSHFGRAGLMTESLLLGALAIRVGKRIEWDARNRKITNLPEANRFIDQPYRKGW
jgi:predicted dehydrogenase